MTAPTTTRLAPIVCTPWCRDRDGHTGEWSIDDQRCTSNAAKVTMSLVPMIEMSDDTWQAREIETFVDVGPTLPLAVHVYEMHTDADLRLTPAEARELAASLLAAADVAEGSR